MSLTTVSSDNQVTQWDSDFFSEYVRANRFSRYMGTDENSVIVVKEDLTVKAGGTIVVPLIGALTGSGVTGNNTLVGNEEALGNFGHKIDVDTLRHGVRVTDHDQQFTEIDLRKAGKAQLKNWAMRKMRDNIVSALGSISIGNSQSVTYGAATAGQRNAWNVANSDRILYGTAESNYNATHATALATLDNTADALTRAVVSHAKRLAEAASPIITPVTADEDSENYVMFCGSRGFRDLKADLAGTLSSSDLRGLKQNLLFRDGDLFWDGVIIRKIQEIPNITGAGTAGIDVAPAYLCGAQAVGVAWAKRTQSTSDVTDYGFQKGVGIHEMRGIEKLVYNGKDHGVLTVFHAAIADA